MVLVGECANEEFVVSNSNMKNLYWTLGQQLAHHTINGCNMRPGDICGTGTISGASKNSYGSFLELTWNGRDPLVLSEAQNITRTFLKDGDEIILTAKCTNSAYQISFGSCTGRILPSL
jgi:fumarylacetoacetase